MPAQLMNAMVLEKQQQHLVHKILPVPAPDASQLLIKVMACGICRTDLHIIDGDLTSPKLPLIPGHEIVGKVTGIGKHVTGYALNDIVGIPWVGHTCGKCKFCKAGKENLCDNALFTGYTIDGGFAEYTVADARFCFPLSLEQSKPGAAPLLCAGLIGYRSYRMINKDARNIGIYGFGAAAHILTQIAVAQGKSIYAFTREGDKASQAFALKMGACWAAGSDAVAPLKLDAAIIFAAAGELIPKALRDVDKAGEVICGGIHMSPIPSFSYDILWQERCVRSVANLTRDDGLSFFKTIDKIPVHTETEIFELRQANHAIEKLRSGRINGAAVLVMD
ncbi:zinc-dependent alcohol dehydrogenase family protein [Mucilaginibacter sp. L3T2-6]|uniref:zinc-dependent alcohol dehydrogenase family protein n=1 Tax=Mucilaginibacter sp. L3T2-6 TaxID=3062491 RepID=UPI002675BA90|nr:zinc-dependent alcohol dehydrogenase family protein [Mucilaginibacter sp. L3T2-6]MDO3642198.1 zinc-dependent alcohol dehydrogenase family protein [Mucilaginibacter sp. L3T2-6]MDV6214693.1 zinc-dependent alcohol dehydrogenase family protein [Mucilaginibacter sp. L3T2-6]